MLAAVMRLLRVLLLFTKSDLKTILIPVTTFTLLATPDLSLVGVLRGTLWTWIHLLQFCIAGQIKNPGEDQMNKPWRPIPSGLIDVSSAKRLRWSLVPICAALSVHYGAVWPSSLLHIAFLLHNELEYDSHWLHRSILNAWGYAMFNAGAVIVADRGSKTLLVWPVSISIAYNALIIATTIHAQDFRDIDGDRLYNRQTIPILFPEASRLTMPLLILSWSIFIGILSDLEFKTFSAVLLLASFVGARFYLVRTRDGDRFSYAVYNVWLAMMQVLHLPKPTIGLPWPVAHVFSTVSPSALLYGSISP